MKNYAKINAIKKNMNLKEMESQSSKYHMKIMKMLMNRGESLQSAHKVAIKIEKEKKK
tara:strand:- start:1473 stop:1646 length:174 start_codon:yes stop_codon:yes gene_type:complete